MNTQILKTNIGHKIYKHFRKIICKKIPDFATQLCVTLLYIDNNEKIRHHYIYTDMLTLCIQCVYDYIPNIPKHCTTNTNLYTYETC